MFSGIFTLYKLISTENEGFKIDKNKKEFYKVLFILNSIITILVIILVILLIRIINNFNKTFLI